MNKIRNSSSGLISDEKKYIWHPFTQMADWAKDDPTRPLVIRSAKGNYLYDINDNKYFDGVSSLWVTLHGHNHKLINSRIKHQLSKVAHTTFLGLTHEPAIKLAKELVEIAPGSLKRVFYSDNGSTAVEIALKMAFQYWPQKHNNSKKKMFLSLRNAYHGDTIGSVSVGGMDIFHKIFKQLLFKSFFAPSPYCYRCPHRNTWQIPSSMPRAKGFSSHCGQMGCSGQCIKEVENILKKHHTRIAAAVVEPMIQGAAGMLTMPTGYLKRFEVLCKRFNVLLICDEVATGFGRTGRMFACEHENIKPDFLCLAKGITAGYLPLAATLTTEQVYKAFLGKYEEYKTFFHGHTYTANPLGCAAALANLEVFKKQKVLHNLQPKIKHMAKELSKLSNHPNIGQIRQLGFMAGIELVQDKVSGQCFPAKAKTGARVCAACRPLGVILRPLGDVIVLMPPLSITAQQITKIIKIIRNVFKNKTS